MIPLMDALRREANVLFDASGFPHGKPFLRRTPEDAYLFVSDAPQRLSDSEQIKARLVEAGLFAAGTDKLWHLDAPFSWYAQLYSMLPPTPPQPKKDVHLPVWHVCSTLYKHPAPIETQPLDIVRRTLKAMEAGERAVLDLAQSLPPTLAVLMRQKMPLPVLAGGLLALWLNEHT